MWTLEKFKEVYNRFQSGDIRVKEFCHNECILESKFYYRKRRLHEHNHRLEQKSDFVPIVISGSSVPLSSKKSVLSKSISDPLDSLNTNVFEIAYPNGVKLRVPINIDLAQLRSLILLS